MPTLYVATIDAWAPSTSLDSQNARYCRPAMA